MDVKSLFERTEKKYVISYIKQKELLDRIGEKLTEDQYPRSTIRSLYFDTDDYRLIRASLEKPAYKEKLRLRSYCTPTEDTGVFLELKKKYDGVVYKRREFMPLWEAEAFVAGREEAGTQILREIAWALRFYPNLAPKMCVSYDRLALKGREDADLRITFDSNLLYRDTQLDLRRGVFGERLLDSNLMVMEIKALNAMPLWLCDALDSLRIYPASFSKYGTAYQILHCAAGQEPGAVKGDSYCA